MDNNDILSVCLITYNHEKYVEQAIDSILMQKTSFNWKLIIADDCSTDSTRSILKRYQQKYPEKIHLILQEKNVGPATNFVDLITFPKSKYIAYLEGDDYWMDENKLQKQVGFLEANPDCVLSFHKAKILKASGELVDDFITNVPENYETIDTLARLGNYIHSPTIVFRNNLIQLPPEYALCPMGDYFLYLLLAEHGKLNYIEEEMAIYRYGVGIHSTHTQIKMAKANIKLFTLLISYTKSSTINEIYLERLWKLQTHFEDLIRKETLQNTKQKFPGKRIVKLPKKIWNSLKSKYKGRINEK